MKRIERPNIKYSDILSSCIKSLNNSHFKTLITAKKGVFLESSELYISLGELHQLKSFVNKELQVTNNKEYREKIVNLYEKLKSNKEPSKFHDKIMIASKRCVYCNQGLANTLDHFLPKAQFPLLSIEPTNLIPCCYDCNSTLNALSLRKNSSTNPLLIHPYFNQDNSIYDEQWIFAKVPSNQPFFDSTNRDFTTLAVTFYTDFNKTQIHKSMHKGLNFQFENLIHEKYVDAAISMIASEIIRMRRFKGTANQLISVHKNYLLNRATIHPVNSYNSVIYHALGNSDLYLETIQDEFF
ncbi:hypothetical protein [Psychrobacter sp. Ps3]|uniref:HNH endonuclease n=1 Tax=Psychrobacter sp. Ps3 TaxID=2790957 RepID=UPI001EDE1969|nr:hypothetical protein [Psychrobacter sp. Ps3]MCG3881815.1 hypothetical protein [Psychrobacter sp. Ps3]